jgi:hypothetical protein
MDVSDQGRAIVISLILQVAGLISLAIVAGLSIFTSDHATVVFLGDLFVLGSALTFAASVSSSVRSGIDYMVAFFFLFFLSIPARAQIASGYFPWNAQLSSEEIALGFGLCSISLISYVVGLALGSPKRLSYKPIEVPGDSNWQLFYSKWAWGIAIFASVICVVLGPTVLLSARFGGQDNYSGISQQLLFISRSISLVAMVMMITLARHSVSLSLRRQNLIACWIYLPIFLLNNYFPALPRFVLFGLLIGLSCCFVDYTRPWIKVLVSVAALLILFTVFPIIKVIAAENASIGDFISLIGRVDPTRYFLNVDFDGFMQIVSSVQYLVDGNPIRYGNNFLGVFLFFVPRGLWLGKPIDSGEIVSVSLGYWYNNVASPLPAEALIGLGLFGPIIVFLLLGYVIARFEWHAGFPGTSNKSFYSFFVFAVFMGFITIILRGALNGVAPQFASGFMVLAIMRLAQNLISSGDRRFD